MAPARSGVSDPAVASKDVRPTTKDVGVDELMRSLNLTTEEMAVFSDDEDGEDSHAIEWALFGKRNDSGRLPYDLQLRVYEERRKKVQSFADAAAESLGSGGSSSSSHGKRSGGRPDNVKQGSKAQAAAGAPFDDEVTSPLKEKGGEQGRGEFGEPHTVSRKLFQQKDKMIMISDRKRKAKVAGAQSVANTGGDLNASYPLAMVPIGRVNALVSQLDVVSEGREAHSDELNKKQKTTTSVDLDARSAAAAKVQPCRAQ
uniref:Uncharacterized protein n=1 Tax=Leersia perrieri TaxID=77586 RepID=A0A0D9XIS7_9ORYZ